MRPALVPLLLCAACATVDESADPWPSERAPTDLAIGWVDGEPITYGDMARFLRTRDALTFSRTLDAMIVDRITRSEAAQLRVDVPVAIVERRTSARYVGFEQRLARATTEGGAPAVPAGDWLERTLGLTPEEFRTFLRVQIEVELLQDRLIRFEQRRRNAIDVSIIVVEDEASVKQVQERLAAGEPFATVARALSKHQTAPAGGRLGHWRIEGDFDDPKMARELFRAEASSQLGPFPRTADQQVFYRFYRIEGKRDGRDEPYRALSATIEPDLEKRPVSVREYVDWRRRMQERHGFLPATRDAAETP
ncbi:MAG: hypothetical protein AAGD14_08775 [Planctomycetota bacterium]